MAGLEGVCQYNGRYGANCWGRSWRDMGHNVGISTRNDQDPNWDSNSNLYGNQGEKGAY